MVVWSVRVLKSVRESFNAAGWQGAPWEARLEAYAGPKQIVEHERPRQVVAPLQARRPK